MSISLSKEDTIKKIKLAKDEIHSIRLSKPILLNQSVYGTLVLDFSGSMYTMYKNGIVQSVIEKALSIAMEFDDDGEMELWIFSNDFHQLPNITLDNVYDYVNREIMNKYNMGGTKYAPVMENVLDTYIKKTSNGLFTKISTKLPEYIIFITDGDNSDKDNTNKIIKKASKYPLFWQFIGIGKNNNFNYLRHLDDMSDRYVDNADFFTVNTVNDISYNKLFDEFPNWLNDTKVKSMLD